MASFLGDAIAHASVVNWRLVARKPVDRAPLTASEQAVRKHKLVKLAVGGV